MSIKKSVFFLAHIHFFLYLCSANRQLVLICFFRLYKSINTHMQDYLNHIFAHAPVPTPDAADLEFEVRDLLRYEEYAQKVFIELQQEPCPYRREGLLECLRREIKQSGMLIEGNLYMKDDNGCCILVWREAEREIKRAIRACEEDRHCLEDCIRDAYCLEDGRSTISSVVQQVKDTVKHTVKEIVKDIPAANVVNINIQQLTIPVHIYSGDIGQVAETITSQQINH